MENNLLDTIIYLPPNLFYGTSIPTCILILKNNKKNKDIFFIYASDYYYKGKRQNKLREEDILKIVSAYRKRKNIDEYCRVVSLDEIKANDYNLNITRYMEDFKDEKDIDLKASKLKIDNLEIYRKKLKNYTEIFLARF